MKAIVIAALLLASLSSKSSLAQEPPGIPVFTDDFSVPGLFAENWKASKGAKCEAGCAIVPSGNNMTLRRVPEGDFAFTADLAVAKPAGKDPGHCGAIIDGIHFMISPSTTKPVAGANTAYRVPGENHSRGAHAGLIPGFEFDKPVRVMVSRVKLGDARKYSYTVNNRIVDSFIVATPADGQISLYGYRNGICVDNFRLYALKGDASKNLAINSSFEYLQEGMPIYMKPLIQRKVWFDGKWEDLLKSFAIDTSDKVSGNNSVRMALGDPFPRVPLPSPYFSNGVGTHNVSVIAKTPVTFSVYLKASEDDFPVTLSIWELWHKNHSQPIKISKSWQRYSFTVSNHEKAIIRANVTFRQAGTVWADDVQVELGNQATTYRPSSLDQDRLADGPKGSARVSEATLNAQQHASQPNRVSSARQIDLYTRYNYYMNEDDFVLVGTLNLADADQLSGKIRVGENSMDVKMQREFAVNVPLKGLASGEHQVTLDVYKGGDKLASATTTLVKRAFKNGATQIDRQRRCLIVDGKPYLAISPFFAMEAGLTSAHQDRVLKNMLRLHKAMGYRCFHVGSKDNPPFLEQTRAFYELCAKEGIKIVHWPFQAYANRGNPRERFQTQTADNIIAWMIIDEPELGLPSEDVEAFLVAHLAACPYTPVFMNNSVLAVPRRYAGLKTDILMLDDYLTNRENRKVVEMIDATDMMIEAGREDHKPVFYFLAGENLPNHHRECTYAEQVAQTYGVIIAGARGVSYFCSLPLYPEDYRACVDVNRELLELEDAIFSLEKTSAAAVSEPAVRFMTRKLGGKLFVIALNADNDRPADVEIALPGEFKYAGSAEVKFEARNVAVKNGKVFDKFKPLQRHVYVADIVK